MKQLLLIAVLFTACKLNAQETKAMYRQTMQIKNGKPIITTNDWQQITVKYLDTIYQYKKDLKQRRKMLIVFGKEGVSPLTEWIKVELKENDIVYNYKRKL